MGMPGRRISFLNIDNWLDKCSSDEPDSIIYEPDFSNDVAQTRTKHKEEEMRSVYKFAADTYTEFGLHPELFEERLRDVDDLYTEVSNIAKKAIQDDHDKFCQYKQDLLDQIQKMLSDLYLPAYVPDENITFLQHCKRLKTKYSELNIIKEERMTRLKELRDKQTRHCLVLGIKVPQVKTQTDIPTEDELIQFKQTVLDLEKEEKQRKEKHNVLRTLIKKCMEELELDSQSEPFLNENPNYTEPYLRKLSDLHSKLEVKYDKAQEKYQRLKSTLLSLYNRLDVPQSERDEFFESHPVCKPSMMVEMETEIERYEELKKQNIGKFIEKIKGELVVEYERCCVSQAKQDEFFSLSGECDDDLLASYETELERCRSLYNNNKDMFEKIQRWRLMWNELIELEIKAKDPNRFNNRGGQLLREEKKRKTLQKDLPKVEKDILNMNDKYSREFGEKFKIFDTDVDKFISGCWDELNNVKEEEKRERQRAKLTDNKGARKPIQPQNVLKRTPAKRAAGAGITPTPSKLQCRETPKNTTYRSNQLGLSGSVKKCLSSQSNNNLNLRGRQPSNGKSNIPVTNSKTLSNSDGSNYSALSVSEQEFEDMIVACPTSAKKT